MSCDAFILLEGGDEGKVRLGSVVRAVTDHDFEGEGHFWGCGFDDGGVLKWVSEDERSYSR